jgi:uncharacterized repeat protein (TIGR01451 family)
MEVSEGEHPGEVISYAMHVRNTGVTALLAQLSDPYPVGAAFVSGSASVVGGGSVAVTSSGVDWQGALNPNSSVTVTYRANITALSGAILNTASISDPLAVSTMVITAATPVQPYAGTSIGQESLYTYRDRYAPGGPAFSWVPTTPQAIALFALNDDDVVTGPLPIHFNFEFFGRAYSQLFVSTNGLVLFGQTNATAYSNKPILAPNSPATNYATCLWTDQVVNAGDNVWIDTVGSAPNRSTIITFRLHDFNATGAIGPYLYQAILFEGSNRIKCQYNDMGISPAGDGRASTVGIRNLIGTGGVQYFYGDGQANHVGPIENGLAIVFDPGARLWLPAIMR